MSKQKGIIDRIEGKWVVVEFEDGMRNLLISLFPMPLESGDVIWIDEYGHIEKDYRERQRLSSEIDELMEELWED